MLVATANSPPRGHLLERLLSIFGDDGTRQVLTTRPGFAKSISRHAQSCRICSELLVQLFPDGVPEHSSVGNINDAELERIFRDLRESGEIEITETPGLPGSQQRGGGA